MRSHRLLVLGLPPWSLGAGAAWWCHDARLSQAAAEADVTSLPDRGPNAVAATTGVAAPVMKRDASGLNGRPACGFTAASTQNLIADALAAVFSGTALPCLFLTVATQGTAGVTGVCQALGRGASSTPSHRMRMGSGNQPSATRTDDAGTTKAGNGAIAVTVGYGFAAAFRFNGLVGDVWLDGRQIVPLTDMDLGATTLDRYSLGARRGATTTNHWTGLIALSLLVARVVTPLQTRLLLRWAAREFGVPTW